MIDPTTPETDRCNDTSIAAGRNDKVVPRPSGLRILLIEPPSLPLTSSGYVSIAGFLSPTWPPEDPTTDADFNALVEQIRKVFKPPQPIEVVPEVDGFRPADTASWKLWLVLGQRGGPIVSWSAHGAQMRRGRRWSAQLVLRQILPARRCLLLDTPPAKSVYVVTGPYTPANQPDGGEA